MPTQVVEVLVVFVLARSTITKVHQYGQHVAILPCCVFKTSLRNVCTVTVSCYMQVLITHRDKEHISPLLLQYTPNRWIVAYMFSQ